MKIELTVHLGTLLTHTVHRYAIFMIIDYNKYWAFKKQNKTSANFNGDVTSSSPPCKTLGIWFHLRPPASNERLQFMFSGSTNQSPPDSPGASKTTQGRAAVAAAEDDSHRADGGAVAPTVCYVKC